MAVYKDGDKWRVLYRYTDFKGERKQTQKRGFATKREALAWEHEAMLKSESKLDMSFASFLYDCGIFLAWRSRVRYLNSQCI